MTCPTCKGTGMWMQQIRGTIGNSVHDYDERECGTCRGTGSVAS
jgi:DnaJ-class molecular chaperone